MNYRYWLLLSLVPLTVGAVAVPSMRKTLAFDIDLTRERSYPLIEGCEAEASQWIQSAIHQRSLKSNLSGDPERFVRQNLRFSNNEGSLALLQNCQTTYETQYFRFQLEDDPEQIVSLGTFLIENADSRSSTSVVPKIDGESGIRIYVADSFFNIAVDNPERQDLYQVAEELYALESKECDLCRYAVVSLAKTYAAQGKFQAAREVTSRALESRGEGYEREVLEKLLRSIDRYESTGEIGGYLFP